MFPIDDLSGSSFTLAGQSIHADAGIQYIAFVSCGKKGGMHGANGSGANFSGKPQRQFRNNPKKAFHREQGMDRAIEVGRNERVKICVEKLDVPVDHVNERRKFEKYETTKREMMTLYKT